MVESLCVPLRLEEGCHLSIFLLSSSAGETLQGQENGDQSQRGHMKSSASLSKYLKAHQSCQTGLASSYLAVVGNDCIQKRLQSLRLGKWHKMPQASTAQAQHDLSPLEHLLQCLESPPPPSASPHRRAHESSSSSLMAAQLHTLMDKIPDNNRYSILDVYWLVEAEDLPPPSCCIDLYGSLLRLKEWHNAHIEIVMATQPTTTATRRRGKQGEIEREGGGGRESYDGLLPGLKTWKEALDIDMICNCSQWEPPVGVIWRGPIHITENRNCKQQSMNQTVSFPGLSLSLSAITTTNRDSFLVEHGRSVADLLHGVGVVSSSYCPTHLQLVQVVDYSSIPLFWISPLRCKLSVASDNSITKALFRSLMDQDNKNMALLMCLCQMNKGLKERKTQPTRTTKPPHTTATWLAHVSAMEEGGEVIPTERSVSPLDAYETGPLLLVTPTTDGEAEGGGNGGEGCDSRELSCDALFLWRPEAINANIFVKLKNDGLRVVDDCDDDIKSLTLPLLSPSDSSFSPTVSPSSPSDIHARLSSLPHELSVPPSESAEMKALKTHEWIQRKMIRRLTTPDLMFGQMVAPPPVGVTSLSESISIGDVLGCFTSEGLPTNSDLSPIAMRDASQVTRVHDPALSDVSYNTIISSTPGSKRQYHGVHYCLTNEDTSNDSKWTKIQQRCLISERAGHCTNVSTPRAERNQRQSRRLKEVQLQNKKQQKMKENEEQKKKTRESQDGSSGGSGTAGGGGEEREKMLIDEKENGAETIGSGDGSSRQRRESNRLSTVVGHSGGEEEEGTMVVLKSKRSLQFPRNDVRTVKSPTVKITKVTSRQRQSGFAKTLKKPMSSSRQRGAGATSPTDTKPLSRAALMKDAARQTDTVNQNREFEEQGIVVLCPSEDRTPSCLEDVHGTESEGNCKSVIIGGEVVGIDSSSVVMECSSSSMASPSVSSICVASEGSKFSPVRRSPRLLKSRMVEKGRVRKASGERRKKSETDNKKEKSLKAHFGQIVVGVLKKNGVSRDHPHFKLYYTNLFNVSKHFLNDLKQLTGRKVVTTEMKRVVQLNVGRVIESHDTM